MAELLTMCSHESGSANGHLRDVAEDADKGSHCAHLRMHLDAGVNVTKMLWATGQFP